MRSLVSQDLPQRNALNLPSFFFLNDPPPPETYTLPLPAALPIWSTIVVVAVAAAAAALLTLIRPTHSAPLPYLAETPDELTLAYAATGLIQSVSVLLGPLLATLVFVLAGSLNGPALLLGVLSGLLIGGTALVATLHPITSSKEVAHHPRHAFAREVRQGIGAAWHDPRPRLLCSIIGLTSFELGWTDVVSVVLASWSLGAGGTG